MLAQVKQEVRFVSICLEGSKDNTVSLINTIAFDPQDEKDNSKIIEDLVNKLKNHCDFINHVGICLDGQDPSLDEYHICAWCFLRICLGTFFGNTALSSSLFALAG